MIKIAVAGAAGRMGKTILSLASQNKTFQIVGAIESAGHDSLGYDIGELMGREPLGLKVSANPLASLKNADVLIDFTLPQATLKNLEAASKTGTAYVVGTTGLGSSILKEIKKASKKIAIVQSPNMSIGVNLLFKLAELTGGVLDESYDIEISEIHHRMKKDSPSGTALKLLEILAKARGKDAQKDSVFGRKGEVGARQKGKIGVFALRGGDVVGEHTISFLGDGEKVELVHKASSREAFAKGALLASKFLVGKKQGLYHMGHVLKIV